MKKNLLFLMILLTSFLIITGCGKKETKKDTGDIKEDVVTRIGDMQFKEPNGYKETNHKLENVSFQTKTYKFNEYTIQLTYRKNKTIHDLKQNLTKEPQVEYNNVKYRFVTDGGGGTTFDSYYTQHDKDAYILEFYGLKNDYNYKTMEELLNSIEYVTEN